VGGQLVRHAATHQHTGTAASAQQACERVCGDERKRPATEAALVAEHLGKRFGGRVAFDDVSFQVGYGEVFGFLGPNGAGKTTMARTLGTLLEPTLGSATVAGIRLSAENGPAIRSRISIMPESPGLYLRLTVAESLECFARLYRRSGGAGQGGAQRSGFRRSKSRR